MVKTLNYIVILIFTTFLCSNIVFGDEISIANLIGIDEEYFTEKDASGGEVEKSEFGYNESNIQELLRYVSNSVYDKVVEELKRISSSTKYNIPFAMLSSRVIRDPANGVYTFYLRVYPDHIYEITASENNLIDFKYTSLNYEDLKRYESSNINISSMDNLNSLKDLIGDENISKIEDLAKKGERIKVIGISYYTLIKLRNSEDTYIMFYVLIGDKIYYCSCSRDMSSFLIEEDTCSLQEVWFDLYQEERELD